MSVYIINVIDVINNSNKVMLGDVYFTTEDKAIEYLKTNHDVVYKPNYFENVTVYYYIEEQSKKVTKYHIERLNLGDIS